MASVREQALKYLPAEEHPYGSAEHATARIADLPVRRLLAVSIPEEVVFCGPGVRSSPDYACRAENVNSLYATTKGNWCVSSGRR